MGIRFLPTAACGSAVLLLGNLQLCYLCTDSLQHIRVPLRRPVSVPFTELLQVLLLARGLPLPGRQAGGILEPQEKNLGVKWWNWRERW